MCDGILHLNIFHSILKPLYYMYIFLQNFIYNEYIIPYFFNRMLFL